MNLRPIILDKSYLQGTPGNRFKELSEQFQFLMPDVLFYELISSPDVSERSICFQKFPQTTNPIPLVKSVSDLLRKELATHKPAGLPSENLLKANYRFNPELSEGSYILSDALKTAIHESEAELDRDMSMYMDFTSLETVFLHIHSRTDEERNIYKSECERYITDNSEELGKALSSLEPADGMTVPTQQNLNKDWTLLRWLQVRLLFNLDLYDRYGKVKSNGLTQKSEEKLKNDVLDMRYLIMGVLQQGFATNDNKLIKLFNLLCPDGKLLTQSREYNNY